LVSPLLFASICTYQSWDWDTNLKKAVNVHKVVKDKNVLTKEEQGVVSGCSVCEEDQVKIKIDSLPEFFVCKKVAAKITKAIKRTLNAKFPIFSIVGYRVGKSKGKINAQGLRTEFSNHSYGTAIDFNSEKNGLYDNCIIFSDSCFKLRGGDYFSDAEGAITKRTPLYIELLKVGFKWGGEIVGKQKDFMHFSLTGM